MFTDELITQVRNLAQVPDSDEDITDEFILTQAYLGIMERFTQPIVMLRNGTWLHSYEFQTTPNVTRYRLPERSIAQGLEKIECALTQNGGLTTQWYLLNVQTNIQATDFEGWSGNRPAAFTYVSDTIDIFPIPTTTWTMRVWYYLRPSGFVTPDETSAVNSSSPISIANFSSGVYSVEFENNALDAYSGIPIDMQFFTGNSEYAVVGAPMVYSGTPTILRVTLTENEADLIARSFVDNGGGGVMQAFLSGNPTFIVPLPQELCNALVSYVGAVVLAEKGDSEKAQVFSQKAELAIKNIVDIAIPRSKGQPSVFKTRSTYLRRRIGRWGAGGGWGAF